MFLAFKDSVWFKNESEKIWFMRSEEESPYVIEVLREESMKKFLPI